MPNAESEKTFLITGASSGIGAATARRAAAEGFRLALVARSKDKLTAVVDELGDITSAVAIPCDVTDYEQQKAMVAATLDAFGRIDVVLANAGIGSTLAGVEGTRQQRCVGGGRHSECSDA